MQMKYMWLALAAPLFLTACTEEDDHASVPEYTKFDYPEWTAAARPEIALPPPTGRWLLAEEWKRPTGNPHKLHQ